MHGRRVVLPKIRVRMFGDFSISINDRTLSGFKGNTKRVWLLVQYLLVHRYETVSIDTLVSDLWNGNLCGDPKNALKNLVYRARSLLRELSGSSRLQFIEFMDDTYRWNNRCECEIDSEQFLALFHKGEDCDGDSEVEQKAECYRQAAALYSGAFLEKSSYDEWVVQKAGEYAEVYKKCVENLCKILFSMHEYAEADSVCRTALQRQPYEVPFYRLLLQACVGDGRRSDALAYYLRTKELFARKFRVDISEGLQPFYSQLVNCGGSVETNLEEIKSDLREQQNDGGAFFCDYDLFRMIYRVQNRTARRTGIRAFLALFSLQVLPEESAGDALYHAAQKLREAVVSSLRSADVVTSYSSVQFLAILPAVSYEDATGVVERVQKNFRFSCRVRVKIKTELSPMD